MAEPLRRTWERRPRYRYWNVPTHFPGKPPPPTDIEIHARLVAEGYQGTLEELKERVAGEVPRG